MSAARDLLAAAGRLLDSFDADVLGEFRVDWPGTAPCRPVEPAALPVLRWLAQTRAATCPRTDDIVGRLIGQAAGLAWRQTYSASDLGAAFLDRYGWTELAGLRGPVASERLAAGFLLLGPRTEYPRHSHEAAEIYLPLSGTAQWQRGDEPWISRPPGDLVHHPHWMPHAMRTDADPLLALYLWRGGDLAQKSVLG